MADNNSKWRTFHVRLPERDEDRRRLFGLMLGLDKRARNHLTVEEMEDLCIKRGYLKVEEGG